MKRICALLFAMLILLFPCACAANTAAEEEPPAEEVPLPGGEVTEMTVAVNGVSFTAVLEENETAAAFAAMLPLTLQMRELNGNEKYFYFDAALPSAPVRTERIEAGDIMLYGSRCAVLFYESFDTSYSYTRIGKISDASALARAAGSGDAEVCFAAR